MQLLYDIVAIFFFKSLSILHYIRMIKSLQSLTLSEKTLPVVFTHISLFKALYSTGLPTDPMLAVIYCTESTLA